MSDKPLWQTAAMLSARAHQNQYRKDGKTPYASHPVRVALTIVLVFQHTDEATLAAALLHDVIEDTATDYDDVFKGFGQEVADLVAAMTKDMRLPEAEREPAYDAQLAAASWKARLIKLADQYDNYTDARDDPKREPKFRAKAIRALKLAEGDERLDKAASLLRSLLR